MWSETDAEKVRASFKRINKIQLSNTANKIFENTIFSFAYPPSGMDDKEFCFFGPIPRQSHYYKSLFTGVLV